MQDSISSNEQLADFITSFEWSVGSGDYLSTEKEIRAGLLQLLQLGYAFDNETAEHIFERLFLAVFKCLRVPGRKRLTREGLRAEVEQAKPISSADRDLVAFIRNGLADFELRLRQVEEYVAQSAATIGTLSAAVTSLASKQDLLGDVSFTTQHVFLDVPDLVTPVIERKDSVNEMVDQLSHTSVLSLVGEPGAGKTQLCLLLTRKLNRPLTWLNIPRDHNVQQASSAVDAMIAFVTKHRQPSLLRPWYDEAARALGECVIVIDNVPRITQGDPMSRRIELLGDVLHKHNGSLLLISFASKFGV
ncbi:MAG: hypothetical protein DMG96_14375 [Acidobacteria bacterium]|nr:MAG: hypothetical protein DMG96_14375 [Acidobacteriota bacterium]